jgi:glycosyltransferase involved in cell wall biosynthesis
MMVPWSVRKPVRRARNGVRRTGLVLAQTKRWREIVAAPKLAGRLAVSYGYEQMPSRADVVYGGYVKFQQLNERLPNEPRGFNVLYLGSSSMPLEAPMLVRLARRRGARFAWNQNGVAYPGWYGPGWELVNAPRARLLHAADHVFFQSAFCKLAADRFYGERREAWEVLYNPVDLTRFAPPRSRPERPLTLLLAGNQYARYRLTAALETVAALRRQREDVRLLISGELSFAEDAERQAWSRIRELELEDSVELTGRYAQAEAPELYARADVLLHTKYNDPCPTVVLEAMASGLPVVFSASGGTPELVGDDAGVGVPAPLDWECEHPPDPDDLAAAVLRILDRLNEYAAAARERAQRFDIDSWAIRHREVFEELTR